jgi:hypothetical protein
VNQDEVSKVMREMGRKGGLKGGQKGGKVRMASLKPEERKELARKAANKRWQKPCRPRNDLWNTIFKKGKLNHACQVDHYNSR